MLNRAAAWWTSAIPTAAAHRGAPAPAERVPRAAWPAPDRGARDARGVRLDPLADDPLAAGGHPAVDDRPAPAGRCAGAAGESRELRAQPRWQARRCPTAATQS